MGGLCGVMTGGRSQGDEEKGNVERSNCKLW